MAFIPGTGIQMVDSTFADAEFSVTNAGALVATSATISGDITVTNPGEFAPETLQYNFGGDASQVLDTGVWNVIGGLTQTKTATGIGVVDDTTDDLWNSSFRSTKGFLREHSPVLEWDFKVLHADGTANYFEIMGWAEDNTGSNHTTMAYAIYINQASVRWRTHSSTGDAENIGNILTVNDVWRLRITLKSGGGALGELFKNGDYTTPEHTYDWGTTGTETTLYVGTVPRDEGTPTIEHQAVSVGSPLSTGTVISGTGISTGKIQSTNLSTTQGTEMDLDGDIIKIGGTGAYTSTDGIVLDASTSGVAKFYVGLASGNYIRFNDTADKLEIKSDNFSVDTNGNITATGLSHTFGGTITTNNINATGSGNIGGFTLTATALSSSNNTLRLLSTNGGSFSLGTVPPVSHTSGKGIFLSGSGQILIGSSSGERIQYDGSNLIMSSSNFFLGSSTAFVSASTGNLEISSSNFHLDTKAGSMRLSGSIFASDGTIGGWTIDSDEIKSGTTFILDSDTNSGELKIGSSGGPGSATGTTAGIYMNGAGSWGLVKDAENRVYNDGTNLVIKSEDFSLSGSTTLAIDTSRIRLGTSATTTLAHGSTGTFLNSSGHFSFVEDAQNFIKGGNSNFEIRSENFTISGSTTLAIDK